MLCSCLVGDWLRYKSIFTVCISGLTVNVHVNIKTVPIVNQKNYKSENSALLKSVNNNKLVYHKSDMDLR